MNQKLMFSQLSAVDGSANTNLYAHERTRVASEKRTTNESGKFAISVLFVYLFLPPRLETNSFSFILYTICQRLSARPFFVSCSIT